MNIFATGPDISSHQHDAGVPLDFKAVKAAGHEICIVKATQNTGYTNPYFVQDVRDAKAASMKLVMPYHYLGPDKASAQVDAMLKIIRPVFRQGIIWMDFEEHSTHAILHEMDRLLLRTPYRPGIYTYPNWWLNNGDPTCVECSRIPLWWANYSAPYVLPAPAPWGQVAIRQTHGTSYPVPGLPGLVDMSRVEVDLAFLRGSDTPPIQPLPPMLDSGDKMLFLITDDPHLWETVGSHNEHINAQAWEARVSLRAHNHLPDELIMHVNPHDLVALLPKVYNDK